MATRRSRRDFSYAGEIWPILESWAAQSGFIEREKTPNRRLYQKRGGLLMAPAFLAVRQDGGKVILEAWVKADAFIILSFLAGQTPEMAIGSGGLTAAVPRKRARAAINPLLERLGQPPIT